MVRRISELVDVKVAQEMGDAPTAFLWRGRLYVVREVLGHWRERREWWSTAAARALQGEESTECRPPAAEEPSFAAWSGGPSAANNGSADGGEWVADGLPVRVPGGVFAEPTGECAVPGHGAQTRRYSTGRHRGGECSGRPESGRAGVPHQRPDRTLPDSECEVWRVEASTGRAYGNGVYDLSRTPSSGPSADSWRLLQVAD